MFVDKVKIHIAGGNGGNGCVSFYRAKYITHGGPDGGDGGKGGSLIFEGDGAMNTLLDFRYKRKYKAPNGGDGGKRNCAGKKGEDLIVKVPVGTLIIEDKSGKIMADISESGQQVCLIPGGRGGWGNQHFATATRQAPKYAQRGQVVKEYDVTLELKIMADVGLIGYPSVGKSSLLKAVTNANPKIGSYHFTTLSPNLGIVSGNFDPFILADIPGLIEGAGEGAGLGHEFLRHVERTKVLVHVVDIAAVEGLDPMEIFKKLNHEMEVYDAKLLDKPMVIACNKMDLTDAEENYTIFKEEAEQMGYQTFPISAATGEGTQELISHLAELLKDMPQLQVFGADFEEYQEEAIENAPFEVTKPQDGYFLVEGVGVEKMVGYTNIETEKGFQFFQKYLREKGIIDALEEAGIVDGDTVRIYDVEFEYFK